MAVILIQDGNYYAILSWWIATNALVIWRYQLIREYRQASDTVTQVKRWGQRFVLRTAAAGLVWYLSKPYLLEDMQRMLTRWLPAIERNSVLNPSIAAIIYRL